MKKRVSVFLSVGLLLLFCVASAFAQPSLLDEIQKRGKLQVGMFLQFPPTEFRDPQTREPKGLEVDIAGLLAKDLGVKLEIIDMEWDAIIPGLLAKKYDVIIASMARTPKRNLSIALTSNNLETFSVMGLVSKDDTRTTIEEFNKPGVVVTSLMGSTTDATAKRVFPKATLKSMQMQPAVLEVETGRADIVLVNNIFSYEYLRKNPGKLKIVFEHDPLAIEPTAIGLRKGDQIFLNWLENWIQFQYDQKNFQPLFEKWFVRGGE